MPFDIKCHKVSQYGYQKKRINQTKLSKEFRIIPQEQNIRKSQKNQNANISFVFWGESLCKIKIDSAKSRGVFQTF